MDRQKGWMTASCREYHQRSQDTYRTAKMPRLPWILYGLLWSYVPLLGLGLLAQASDSEEQCNQAMGMQSHEIPDSAISASSSYGPELAPQHARIRTETGGGAWCPEGPIDKDSDQWLQIDLGGLKIVSMVETQGRFGSGQGQEYTSQYRLEYQRDDDGPWFRFRDRKGDEIVTGNTNPYMTEIRPLDPEIIVRRLRFVPHSDRPETVCLRVEVYGCDWTDGTVSYAMPQGERRGSEVDLYDYTYDGTVRNNYLSGGLGQLTDRKEGHYNFRHDPAYMNIKGYEWVGWKNESFPNKPVELLFKFDEVRNFTKVRVHSNNLFTKGVRVFRMARLWFSVGGEYYQDTPVEYEHMRDTLMSYDRTVVIKIDHRIGKFIKMQLYFDSKWMMISEVRFSSTVVEGVFEAEQPPTTTPVSVAAGSPDVKDDDVTSVGKKNASLGADGINESTPPEAKTLEDEYVGVIVGALAALLLLLLMVVLLVVWHHRRRKYNNNHRAIKSIEPRHITLNLNDLQATPLPLANPNDACTTRDYAIPDMTKSSLMMPAAGGAPILSGAPPPAYTPGLYGHTNRGLSPTLPPPAGLPYASTDVINIPNIQGVSGNTVYAVPNSLELSWKEDLSVMEFPRDNVKYVKKLGEGQFGEVHLCEAVEMNELLGDDFLINRGAGGPLLVATKTLRRNADDQARSDFHKEVKIMCCLKDPNIVRVLGVCTVDEPLCVIVEYMKYGDLNQFLKQHVPSEGTINRNRTAKTLSYGCVIYMATQIASGMKYLEGLNMVHRDLATRNCLVGNNYTIKISDFGMSRSLYSTDYYRLEGRAVLPIRWMAWESILLGKFSTKSDVWSFGVTLWEIVTFARLQPYEELSDEQVIENCGHVCRGDGREVWLPPPGGCPREIYDLMRECWNRDEVARPTFHEIHMFMQRKNMGYNPRDDAGNSHVAMV